MPTEQEKELKRLKGSGLASNRIAARDAERLMSDPSADISATTSNRMKRGVNQAKTAAAEAADFAQSPVGQFQGRMAAGGKKGYDPFAGIPTEATANYRDPNDLLGTANDAPAAAPMAKTGDPFAAPQEQPKARIGMGRQDEQRLAAMGPEYLAEAERVAQVGERKPMTATINGQSFSQTPGASVDRNTLGMLARKIAMENLQKRGLEDQARKYGQEQTMARIPGQNAVDLAKQQGGDKVAAINAEGAIQAPTRAANIAKSNAEVATIQGKEKRGQAEFDRDNSPEELARKTADEQIAQLIDSGRASTPEGQALIKLLTPKSSIGRMGPGASDPFAANAGKPSPEQEFAAVEEFIASPEAARLVKEINDAKQGYFWTSGRNKKSMANRKGLDSYIDRFARARGIDPNVLADAIQSQFTGAY